MNEKCNVFFGYIERKYIFYCNSVVSDTILNPIGDYTSCISSGIEHNDLEKCEVNI